MVMLYSFRLFISLYMRVYHRHHSLHNLPLGSQPLRSIPSGLSGNPALTPNGGYTYRVTPWNVNKEATFMMLPRRFEGRSAGWESMCAPTSRHSVKTAVRFTCRTACQSSSGNWWAGCRFWIPPQLSRMWILWPAFRICGTRAETEELEERSAVQIVALRPRTSMADLVDWLEVSR